MNKFQLVFSIALVVIIALAVILLLRGFGDDGTKAPEFEITVWGTDPDETRWRSLINTYTKEQSPNAKIEYVPKDPRTYEAELLNALASGAGPDAFFLSNTLLAKHRDKVQPLQEQSLGYTKQSLKAAFPDAVVDAVTGPDNELLGTPLYFDTLALFYNRDYLNTANIPLPPATWDELVNQSRALTRYAETGAIRRSGVAMGSSGNVAHAHEIMALLIYQSGGDIVNSANRASALNSPETETALGFYTAFVDPTKRSFSWNALFPPSIDAFSTGDAAFVLGYAADAERITALNPQLNFDVAPVPQPTGANIRINMGRFDIIALSRLTKEANNAWHFLLWLQERDVQKRYADARALPPARRDLIASQPPREYLAAFYGQILSARTLPVEAGDSLARILGDMIDSAATRQTELAQAVQRAHRQLAEALRPPDNP
ncbi:extracellular solute-binding protein [Candidatus Parcubacteria bacterium]|nr:MAG: extracellular solute-binding protein [Candidatus Parcubacteria bacterium]